MKNVTIKLNEKEYSRFVDFTSNHFMKVVRPFVFRGEDNNIYCLHHGDSKGGLLGGASLQDIRCYAEKHSNIKSDEVLHLICCYGSTIVDTDKVKVSINNTPYPVLVGYDENNNAVFGVLETDSDISELKQIMSVFGGISDEDCKAH